LEEPAKSDVDKTLWTTTNNEAHSSRTYQLTEYLWKTLHGPFA